MTVLEKMTQQSTLAQLRPGETATVTGLTSEGADRRRLMDLGILPGTRLTAEFASPLGDPVAYRVRGALIALRRDQARTIQIALESQESTNGDEH